MSNQQPLEIAAEHFPPTQDPALRELYAAAAMGTRDRLAGWGWATVSVSARVRMLMDVYIAAAKSRPGVAVGLPVSYQTLLRVTDSGGVTLVEGGVAVEGLARFSAELGGGTAVQNLVADPNTGECIPGTRLLRGTEAARFVPGYGRRGDKIAELVVLSPAVSSAEQLQERAFGLFAGCTERPWQWGEGLYALLQADVLATASWQVDCVVAQAVASLTRSGMPSITDRLLDEARVLSQRAFVERMFRRMAR